MSQKSQNFHQLQTTDTKVMQEALVVSCGRFDAFISHPSNQPCPTSSLAHHNKIWRSLHDQNEWNELLIYGFIRIYYAHYIPLEIKKICLSLYCRIHDVETWAMTTARIMYPDIFSFNLHQDSVTTKNQSFGEWRNIFGTRVVKTGECKEWRLRKISALNSECNHNYFIVGIIAKHLIRKCKPKSRFCDEELGFGISSYGTEDVEHKINERWLPEEVYYAPQHPYTSNIPRYRLEHRKKIPKGYVYDGSRHYCKTITELETMKAMSIGKAIALKLDMITKENKKYGLLSIKIDLRGCRKYRIAFDKIPLGRYCLAICFCDDSSFQILQ